MQCYISGTDPHVVHGNVWFLITTLHEHYPFSELHLIQIPQAGSTWTIIQSNFVRHILTGSTGPRNRELLNQSEQAFIQHLFYLRQKQTWPPINIRQWAFLQTMNTQYISIVYATRFKYHTTFCQHIITINCRYVWTVNIVRVIKSRGMRWAGTRGTYGERERCAQGFGGETWGKENHWGDQDVDGRIILRWIFGKWEGVVGTGWCWVRIGTDGGRLWVR